MAFVAPLLTAMAPMMPLISAGATALSGLSAMQSANYQSAVAANNAKIVTENAQRETLAANQDLQDKDTAARAEIGMLVSQMDASGLNSGSGSMLLRRTSAEELARRDRERIAQKRDTQLSNSLNEAAGYTAEARAAKTAGRMGLLSTFLDIPTSYLSSASTYNDYKRGRLSLENPSLTRT